MIKVISTMMKVLLRLMICLCIVICIAIGLFIVYGLCFYDKDYERGVYSVVVHNQSNEDVYSIGVYLDAKSNGIRQMKEYDMISELRRKEYRKINVKTQDYFEGIILSFYDSSNKFVEYRVGIPEIGAGGFTVVNMRKTGDIFVFERLSEFSWKHKILYYMRHLRNQNETSWY